MNITIDAMRAIRANVDPRRLAAFDANCSRLGELAKAPAMPKPKQNKTEQAYARRLDALKFNGEILWWGFETLKLKLGDGAWYTPDFVVVYPERRIQIVEVKGFWREAARVRIKVAASAYRFFDFVGVQRVKGEWVYEQF